MDLLAGAVCWCKPRPGRSTPGAGPLPACNPRPRLIVCDISGCGGNDGPYRDPGPDLLIQSGPGSCRGTPEMQP